MSYHTTSDWRSKRNHLNHHMNGTLPAFNPMHYSIASYCTDQGQKKVEMKRAFGDEVFLNNLQLLPNPFQKNLADTIVTEEKNPRTKMASQTNLFFQNNEVKQPPNDQRTDYYPSLSGISNFFSGVFSVISSAVFQKRTKSPVTQYYDCNQDILEPDGVAADRWLSSKNDDLNKNERAHEQFSISCGDFNIDDDKDMNVDCRTAAATCEDKINKVRLLLSSKPVETPPKYRRRPRKVFVEPGSVEEKFEDAFSPEDFKRLSNENSITCISPCNHQKQELLEIDAPMMKTETFEVQEKMDIVKTLDEYVKTPHTIDSNVLIKPSNDKMVEQIFDKTDVIKPKQNTDITVDTKQQIITSCEDKVNKLKALLQERCKKNTNKALSSSDSVPETIKENERPKQVCKTIPIKMPHDKHFKNPNRLSVDKRKKSRLRKQIEQDASFAHEIDAEELSYTANSPSINITPSEKFSDPSSVEDDYFDEVTGRFRSTSTTESEDSFQIVFADSPQKQRTRKVSDCDSEDSFIVFEDSPESCYTSNDVFGDEPSDFEDTDSDSNSDSESDTEHASKTCKLSHSLCRTVGDLTDDSLYDEENSVKSEDVVDCAFRTVCEEISVRNLDTDNNSAVDNNTENQLVKKSTGLLIDNARRLQRKNLPGKRVHFSSEPPKVHVMRVWTFAARQARAGQWERLAVDRERFKRRIADVDVAVSWVLKPQHRSRIMFQRFMPWWNAQKRKELAEKKAKEQELAEKKAKEQELEDKKAKEKQERIEAEQIKGVCGNNETVNLKTENDHTEVDIVDFENKSKSDTNIKTGAKTVKELYINNKRDNTKVVNDHINVEIVIEDSHKSQNDTNSIIVANENGDCLLTDAVEIQTEKSKQILALTNKLADLQIHDINPASLLHI